MRASKLIISLSCILFITETRAQDIPVRFIQPETTRVLEGSNIILTCQVQDVSEGSVDEVRWYKYASTGFDEIVPSTHANIMKIDNRTVALMVQNITGIGMQYYCCGFDERGVDYIRLYVGIVPKPPVVQCYSRSQKNYWCEYSEAMDTGLASNFTMEYTRDIYHYPEDANWQPCIPEEKYTKKYGQNTCYVQNSRWEQDIRVNQSNHLGTTSTTRRFYPLRDAIPNPVDNLRVTNATSRSLTIAWSRPAEWTYSAVRYKVMYTASGSLETQEVGMDTTRDNPVEKILKDLLPYTNYTIDIVCQGAVNSGANWSESVLVTGQTQQEAPAAPVNGIKFSSTFPSDPYQRDVAITWEEVPEKLRHGLILGYNVYIETDDGENITDTVIDRSYLKSGLRKFQTYTVSVAATTVAGEGPNATIILPDLTSLPLPPELEPHFPIARSAYSIEVKWKAPEYPRGYVEYYRLEWSHNKADWVSALPIEGLGYLVEDLKPNTGYTFCLWTKNKLGDSENKTCTEDPVKTPGINWVIVGLSLLGAGLLCISAAFLVYWLKKSDITKPGPAIVIPEVVNRYQINVNIQHKSIEKEFFDDIDIPPAYGDYVDLTSDAPETDGNRNYQNGDMLDERNRSDETSSDRKHSTNLTLDAPNNEMTSDYMDMEAGDAVNNDRVAVVYANTMVDNQGEVPERVFLKPTLSHTSSSNSYTNAPSKLRPDNEQDSYMSGGKEDHAYSLLSDATTGEYYTTCSPVQQIPHAGIRSGHSRLDCGLHEYTPHTLPHQTMIM